MRTVLVALLLMTLASMQSVFALNDIPALMPMPQEVRWGGGVVQFDSISIRTSLGDVDQDSRRRIDFAVDRFRAQMDEVGVTVSGAGEYPVGIRIDEVGVPRHADESYLMSVTEKGARITAPTATGVFYALQTLRQLIDNTTTGSRISTVEIRDYPSFGIRGFMHDVGRNFISLEKLKEQIDIMAFYKLNVFHWHLSDDPGWRLESKLYPELQAEHAFTRMPGMYYTQAEFIEMVEYCWLRNITVIPELDSPGHTAAFRRAFNCVMRDPIAKERMVNLIHELCSLASPEIMPYIHLGTDEVRNSDEYVGDDYLPALYRAVRENEREVISWWHGLYIPGETGHIQQTWASHAPRSGIRHIDSRSNYVNHMCVMDAPLRMLFQQPGRVPHSDEINLGGILCYWPDTKVENEDLSFTNSPVYTSMVAYSEAVWTGIEKDQPEYWAQIPPPGTEAFERFREFEHRLLGQRRFLTHVPFQYVRQTDIPWRLIGPFRSDWLDEIETPENGIRESYRVGDREYRWWEDASIGGTVHVRHFFGFESAGSDREFGSGEDVVYALTYLHSPKEQEVDFWISFNTTSTSDPRSGAPVKGHWGANPICDIWVNDERVRPPNWYQPGRVGREVALVDEVYTSRPPTTVLLQEGWNKVLLRTAPHWKWSYTFVPVSINGHKVREVSGLRFALEPERRIRVACIGDSITYGLGIADRECKSYPARLQEMLGDERFEVRNFGHAGAGFVHRPYRGMPEYSQALEFEPDIVICNLGINDITTWGSYTRTEFIDAVTNLLESFKKLPTDPIVIQWRTLSPLFPGQRFYGDPNVQTLNEWVADATDLPSIESIEMQHHLQGYPEWYPDKLHPNAAGARRIAEVTYEYLSQIESLQPLPQGGGITSDD